MFTYRLRGLVNLYQICVSGFASGFFLLLAAGTRYAPWITLSPDVNLVLCVLAIVVGMAANSRYVTAIGWRMHDMSWPESAALASRQTGMVALILFTAIVATKDRSISRLFLGYYLGLSWIALIVVNRTLPRALAALAFSRDNRLPTLFVGNHRHLEHLTDWIARKHHLGVTSIGFVSDDYHGDQGSGITRFWGRTSSLESVIRDQRVAQVILLNLPTSQEETRSILAACQSAGVRILVYDNISDRLPVPMIPVVEEGQSFYTMQTEPLEDPFNRAIKRIYDVAIALPVVVFILPILCAVVWCFQRIQAPGPLFFVRPRGGRQRMEFGMVKFRSMYHAKLADAASEAVQARQGDRRIYPFGAFIRRTSIDEFPQFWNVLVGDMSIVGPRPHLPQHDTEFSQVATVYRTRQLVKPGITGLAQVRGYRGEIVDPQLLHQRIELDIRYITSWSIWLDVQITIRTFLEVILPPGSAR